MKIHWLSDIMWAVVLTTVYEQEKKKDFVTLFLHVPVKKNPTAKPNKSQTTPACEGSWKAIDL